MSIILEPRLAGCSLPYTPLRATIHLLPGSIPVNVYGDEIDEFDMTGSYIFSHSL